MKKKGLLLLLLSVLLCLALSVPASAAETPASGQAGSSSIRVSIQELSPGYYLGAVWDGDELLTLFDATVGSNGTLEQTVEVGKTLQQNDRLTVGISGENAGTSSVTYPVVLSGNSGSNQGGNQGGSQGSSSGSSRPSGSSSSNRSPKDTSGSSSTSISAPTVTGGSVSVSPSDASKGEQVTVTARPDAGYTLDSLTVRDQSGQPLDLIDMGSGSYTFIMPAGTVSIDAVFRESAALSAGSALPFDDVREKDWFYTAVQYVYGQQLMSGVTPSYFAPEGQMTRAMLVSVLYRMSGVSAPGNVPAFADVPAGAWFADAVAWANANGIASGYSASRFGPEDPVTCEQLTAILYRFAARQGYDTSASADLSRFPDAGAVGSYAEAAVRWAVGNGLLSGDSSGRLVPQSPTVRGQVAAILMRFCENVKK